MSNFKKPITYTTKYFKSILNKRNVIDSWFWDKYSINPYNGCQIGCIYCNSRKSKYHLPVDFEKDIVIKSQIDILLRAALKKISSSQKDVISLSGSTDPYQAVERRYFNTKKCLKVLLEHEFPVHIITKSRLVLRDLDILDKIGEKSWCTVSISVSTFNKNLAKFLEPGAPFPKQRLEIIETIKEKAPNIQTGVLAMPTIPFLCDSPQDIHELCRESSNANSDYLIFAAGLTMADIQAEWFLSKLHMKYAGLIPLYEKLFSFKSTHDRYMGRRVPNHEYQLKINQLYLEKTLEFDLTTRIKRYIPDDYRKSNYSIAERLHNLAYKLQITGESGWREYSKFGFYLESLNFPIESVFEKMYPTYLETYSKKVIEIVEQSLKEFSSNNLETWF